MVQPTDVLKITVAPIVASTEALEGTFNQKGGARFHISFGTVIAYVITIALMALAGYLCWECNMGEKLPLRIIYTVFAVIFNWIYLIYYFIYHRLMKNDCQFGKVKSVTTK
jgi:hypothetical protein